MWRSCLERPVPRISQSLLQSLAHYGPDGHGAPLLVFIGIALMFVGLGFKVAAAPFHVWTPDVYEGAPSPVVGFMSTAPKAAVFAVLLRIMFQGQPNGAPGELWLIWVRLPFP